MREEGSCLSAASELSIQFLEVPYYARYHFAANTKKTSIEI